MFKFNPLRCLNFTGSRLGDLRLSSRRISICFTGISLTRAEGRLKTLNNTNQPTFIPKKSLQTLYVKGHGSKIKKRDCFDILSSSKHFPKETNSIHQVKKLRYFSLTSKDVLPDESTQEKEKYDFEDENIVYKDSKKSKRMFGRHEYEFDTNGYLSVDDVVKFLRQEAAFDICVIESSGAKRAYVDYFIVVSGVSNRHIRAMSKNLEQLFRGRNVRGISKNGHVTVEGIEGDSNWLAVDIERSEHLLL
ncbi:uncharacterized protein LOC116297368 isoform X2 [Actinia tenebrosa]|uniref:Uncharacterized protein LOC116297368 isoform X2 n=1 Tax=Actinia tenebrosa TaxID=6105 RepID=A0A6P8I9W9_ACTTE|nr:uncharacterized protein LOC116297368 isoform X2 [Actinia tenebrosa]